MRRGILALVPLLAGACPDPIQITSAGEDTWKFFPLDGERTWTFQSDDATLPYRLVAHKPKESELIGDTTARAYIISFTPDCLGTDAPCDVDGDGDGVKDLEQQPLFTWRMSSDSAKGASFHAFNDTAYDPPIRLADADQSETDVVTTETGGVTYTSQIIDKLPCDVPYWRGSPPDGCKLFELDDAGAGTPFAGQYMAIVQFGIVSFQQGGGPTWQLKEYSDEL